MSHGDAREGKWRGNWRMEWVASTLTRPRNVVYPPLLTLMRTPRLPAVDWTDAPADLNGLVRLGERRNLVSARVPSGSARALPSLTCYLHSPRFEGGVGEGKYFWRCNGESAACKLKLLSVKIPRKFCSQAFFLPKDEFRCKYLTSIKQSVTHFKIKDTQDSHFIMYAQSNMPNQVQYRLLTQIHLGLLPSSVPLTTTISNLLFSTPTLNTRKSPMPQS